MSRIYDANSEECVIISKSDEPTAEIKAHLPPNQNDCVDNGFILNKMVSTNDEPQVVFPFNIKYENKKLNISNASAISTMGNGLQSSQRWTNRKAVVEYANEHRYWAPFTHPAWRDWQAQVPDNEGGTWYAGGSVYSQTTGYLYNQLENTHEDKVTAIAFSEPSYVNVDKNQFGASCNYRTSQSDYYGSDVLVSSIQGKSFNLGFEAIISGQGLTNYVNKMNQPTATNNQKMNRLFFIRVKGGFTDSEAFDLNTWSSGTSKFYSFDKDWGAASLTYKKIANDVYYIKDNNFAKYTLNSIYGTFIIYETHKVKPITRYYTGTIYPDSNTPTWSTNKNDATKFNTYNAALAVINSKIKVHPDQYQTDYNMPEDPSGCLKTYLSQPYIYNQATGCSFGPSGNFYHWYITAANQPTYYYSGSTTTYDSNGWTTITDTTAMSIFNSTAQIQSFSSNITDDPNKNNFTSNIITGGQNYISANDSNNYMFNMPQVKIMALTYNIFPY